MKVWKKPLTSDIRGVGVGESLKPDRPEPIGRPAGLPLVKLADLLAEEPENADSGEIDTGPAVGREIRNYLIL